MDYRDYRRKKTNASPDSRPARPEGATTPRTEEVGEPREVRRAPAEPSPRVTNRKSRQRGIRSAVLALVCAAVLIVALGVFSSMTSGESYKNVARSVTVEIGRKWIVASDFLLEKNMEAEFAEGVEYDLTKLGKYKIKLIVNGERCTSTLIVTDSVAPVATTKTVTIHKGDVVEASAFVENIEDATAVKVEFAAKPDTSNLGVQTVKVVLTDEGGNKTQYDVTLNVVSENELIAHSAICELGQPMPPTTVFTGNGVEAQYLSDVGLIDTTTPGIYMLQLKVGAQIYDVTVEVKDTKAPTATVTPQTSQGKLPLASDFVSEIVDASDVVVKYANAESLPREPLAVGRIDVEIVLTDKYGNSTTYKSYINVEFVDTEAPVFTKLPNSLEVDAGATAILWRGKVEATDNSGSVDIYLDSSSADLNNPGKYIVNIVAEDKAGNKTEKSVTLIVKDTSVTDEMLNSVIDDIIENYVDKEATPSQQVYNVYAYIYENLKYANTAAHDDWRREAYKALTTNFTGDCFTHCAVGYALLDRLGFDVLLVERAEQYKIEGTGTHFWVMVNIGTEEHPQWYHFDATPQRAPFHLQTYLMTDAQLLAFTKWRNEEAVLENYYSHDTSLYPASATKILVDLEIPAKYFS